MKTKQLFFCSLTGLALLTTSCSSNDEALNGGNGASNDGNTYAQIAISVANSATTRAVTGKTGDEAYGDDAEYTVNDLTVGYEDGGLLTDAIRKTPNCVLLLDEIEKAHSDIYNILLQVMDYARLTDNKGQKADFRNVILIMTSNAGAQYASRASVGFNGNVSRGEAMLAQVKKTFKPEFINRLSDMVVFSDMDKHMAELILAKKLRQLDAKLAAKGVTVTLTDAAREQLLKWGFTREYGAREMDRVIGNRLKPILMKALLFGKLKKSGKAHVDFDGKELVINY